MSFANVDENVVQKVLQSLGYPTVSDEDLKRIIQRTAELDVVTGGMVHDSQQHAAALNDGPPRLSPPHMTTPCDIPPATAAGAHYQPPPALSQNYSAGLLLQQQRHDHKRGAFLDDVSHRRQLTSGGGGGVQHQLSSARPLPKNSKKKNKKSSREVQHPSKNTLMVEEEQHWGQIGNVDYADQYQHLQRYQPFVQWEQRQQQEKDLGVTGNGIIPPPSPPSDPCAPPSRKQHHQSWPTTPHHVPLQQHRTGTIFSSRSACNVLYAFTDHRSFRHASSKVQPIRKSVCDPVRRGQQFRDAWAQDRFLSQKTRTEERWEVRRSMLGW